MLFFKSGGGASDCRAIPARELNVGARDAYRNVTPIPHPKLSISWYCPSAFRGAAGVHGA